MWLGLKIFVKQLCFDLYESFSLCLNWRFWRLKWLLSSHYFLFFLVQKSSRYFPKEESKRDFIYGETPFLTTQQILKWSEASPQDTLWELGCGRGTFAFFAAYCFGLRVVGIDYNENYINIAKLIKKKLNLKGMDCIQGDLLKFNFDLLPTPDLIYLAWTSFSDNTSVLLTKRLEKMPIGTKIVTLSFPIPSEHFHVIAHNPFWFSWGTSTAYLQIKQ